MESRTLEEHLFGEGPKRLLALDGGGIRGEVTLSYLARMESLLRHRHGNDPGFRLCDYFDLIGGTSTGSIIATGLALGYSVDELRDIYQSLAHKVFDEQFLRFGVFSSKFDKQPLVDALTDYLGDETLGSAALRTGLMVVAKRLDTGSPWVLHNNPRGSFFAGADDQDHIPNRDLPLSLIVRASAAAPHYFEPVLIPIAPRQFGAFIDGAVSPYNNPALQLLMVATLSGYGFNWPMGADNLLLTSVGTGRCPVNRNPHAVMDMKALQLALTSITSVMDDANWLTQTILQWIGRTATPWTIDSEVGDLRNDTPGGAALLSYLRYDLMLETDWLQSELAVQMSEEQCARLHAIDEPDNVGALRGLGDTAAAAQVDDQHFPPGFDL